MTKPYFLCVNDDINLLESNELCDDTIFLEPPDENITDEDSDNDEHYDTGYINHFPASVISTVSIKYKLQLINPARMIRFQPEKNGYGLGFFFWIRSRIESMVRGQFCRFVRFNTFFV